jgi:hypothetical protein
MREYLYAGAQVMTGDWLNYPQLAELGIETTRFADFPEIPALLLKVLANPISQEEKERRRAELGARYSWNAVRGAWLDSYS